MSRKLSLLGVLSCAVVNVSAAVFYVDASVPGGADDGSSWGNAFANLQDALQSVGTGDQIRVAKGIYYPDEGGGQVDDDRDAAFELPDGVALFGGFLSGQSQFSQRDPEANLTILSGDIGQDDLDSDGDLIVARNIDQQGVNSINVLIGEESFILDGFVINAGDAGNVSSGGGLVANGSSPTVRDCHFIGNTGFNGGAVTANGASGVFERCFFENNVGVFRAGGMLALATSLQIIECHFEGNGSSGRGGALEVSGGKIAGCRFVKNFGQDGSAISVLNGTPDILNCVFHHNGASRHGTVYLKSGFGTVIGSCTFSGNVASELGAGIYADIGGTTTISHCLIWGNESEGSVDGVDFHVTGTAIPIYRHCLIEGWNPAGVGNVDGTLATNAPIFEGPAIVGASNVENVDLRLKSNSVGINQGDESELAKDVLDLDGDGNTTDFLPIDAVGNSRTIFSKPDIGAYESSTSVIHVKSGGVGLGGDGVGWANAVKSLAKALDLAEPGQDLWVAEGVYLPTFGNPAATVAQDRSVSFDLKSGVGLFGGFAGGELERSDRKPGANRTILSGDVDGNDPGAELVSYQQIVGANSFHVVDGSDTGASATLDGFVITGGQAGEVTPGTVNNQGGGMVIEGGEVRVRNCVFTGNSALHGSGGGVHCRGAARPTFANCLFQGNAALLGSAAIVGSQSDVPFVNCTVARNTTVQDPATTGAIYVVGAAIEMENCLVWGNDATNATGSLESISYLSASGKIRHSLIEHSQGSGAAWDPAIGLDGGGNLDADPSFVGLDDLRIMYDSPAIDAGNGLADLDGDGSGTTTVLDLIPTDLEDLPRAADGDSNESKLIDMGCFEYQGVTRADIDDDGLSDFFELQHTNPVSATLLAADVDQDKDGMTNLEEFVFGQDPNSWGQPIVPNTFEQDGENVFGVDYFYDPFSATFVDLDIEWSLDLDQWEAIGQRPRRIDVSVVPPLYRIYPSEDQLSGGKGFVRFRVQKKDD